MSNAGVRATVVRGDARNLGFLPDRCVQAVCCSPPYYALRDYQTGEWVGGDPDCQHRGIAGKGQWPDKLTSGKVSHPVGAPHRGGNARLCRCGAVREDRQIGLEATLDGYVAQLVEVGREIWRVLRDDGVWFLNIGDTFNSYQGSGGRKSSTLTGADANGKSYVRNGLPCASLKEKDLMGVPWRVAFALQEAGWYLRADIIWDKPSAVPESVMDRVSRSHEYVFFLTKSSRYFYDADAIREPLAKATIIRDKSSRIVKRGKSNVAVNGANFGVVHDHETTSNPLGRNCRSVWRLSHAQGYKGKHFAVMPLSLAERCLRAGTSERGACPECGAPWARVVRRLYAEVANSFGERDASCIDTRASKKKHIALADVQNRGWRPSCDCYEDAYRLTFPRYSAIHTRYAKRKQKCRRLLKLWRERNPIPVSLGWPTAPCLVLDPFGGAGTTAVAAELLGLRSVVVELSQEYCAQAVHRINERSEHFARPHKKQAPVVAGKRAPLPGQLSFLGDQSEAAP